MGMDRAVRKECVGRPEGGGLSLQVEGSQGLGQMAQMRGWLAWKASYFRGLQHREIWGESTRTST